MVIIFLSIFKKLHLYDLNRWVNFEVADVLILTTAHVKDPLYN